MLDTIIDTLGKELDIRNQISSKAPGTFTIDFDENNQVQIFQFDGGYRFYSTVAYMPQQVEPFLNLVMEGNLFGQGTRGAVLGLNDDGNRLVLSQEFPLNTMYPMFKDMLEDFLNVADFWRSQAKSFQ